MHVNYPIDWAFNLHAIDYTGSLINFSLLAGDIYKVLHNKPLSNNGFAIIYCIYRNDVTIFCASARHKRNARDFFFCENLQILGKVYRLGGQYKVSFSSLFLFISVEHFLVILRLHPYVLSPKLSTIDQALREQNIRLLKQINTAKKCNYEEHWLR